MGFKAQKLWSPPYLQVALDTDNLAHVESIITQLPNRERILLEAGTPLVKKLGVSVISKIRELAPDAFIIADLKTLDVGRVEVKMSADETADAIAISGLGTVESIRKAIHETKKQGIGIPIVISAGTVIKPPPPTAESINAPKKPLPAKIAI